MKTYHLETCGNISEKVETSDKVSFKSQYFVPKLIQGDRYELEDYVYATYLFLGDFFICFHLFWNLTKNHVSVHCAAAVSPWVLEVRRHTPGIMIHESSIPVKIR